MDDARSNITKLAYKLARAVVGLCVLFVGLCEFVFGIFFFSAAMHDLELRDLYNQPFNVTELIANNVGEKKVSLNVLLGADTVCILGSEKVERVMEKYFPGKSIYRLDSYYSSLTQSGLESDDPRWAILAANDSESDVRILEIWEERSFKGQKNGFYRPSISTTICSRNLIVSSVINRHNYTGLNIEEKPDMN